MLRKLMKNKKAQQTAEYALLISLVVAAVIAMQTYAQRTIQGRIRDAASYMSTQTSALGTTVQYEPYYLETGYNVTAFTNKIEVQGLVGTEGYVEFSEDSNRLRAIGGYQTSTYETAVGVTTGL